MVGNSEGKLQPHPNVIKHQETNSGVHPQATWLAHLDNQTICGQLTRKRRHSQNFLHRFSISTNLLRLLDLSSGRLRASAHLFLKASLLLFVILSTIRVDSRPRQHPNSRPAYDHLVHRTRTYRPRPTVGSPKPTLPKDGAQEDAMHLPKLQGPAAAHRGRLQLLQRPLLRQAPAARGPQVHRARRRQSFPPKPWGMWDGGGRGARNTS